MKFEDYETLPTTCITTNMTAGAFAGVMEHCLMYPLDSVKTRMQSLVPTANGTYRGIGEALVQMVTKEGVFRPVRGMGIVIAGAGPAHALYFSSYEYIRDSVMRYSNCNTTISSGIAGCLSTVVHDGIMTPTDVVKQRLQMFDSPYRKTRECIIGVYNSEGMRAFYRSYTTQLLMNVPFQCIHFMTYEMCQNITNSERKYNPMAHMVSGAIAGGVAAAVTTPLDVCKTLLNTQRVEMKVNGLLSAVKMVHTLGGPFGFFRGLSARVLFQMPSTAICWTTYEFFKYILTNRQLLLDQPLAALDASKRHASSIDGADHSIINDQNDNIIISNNNNDNIKDTNNSENNLFVAGRSLLTSSSSSASSSSSYPSKSCELPVISGSSVLNAFSLSTVHHHAESVTTNALIDVSRQ